MSLLKMITDLEKTDTIADNDLLILETANGTHSISYSDLSSDQIKRVESLHPTLSCGTSTRPIYFKDGNPVVCEYTLNANVPINAVFTDTVYENATTTNAGLMSSNDKIKLDGLSSHTDIKMPFSDTAAGHNGIFRGKDLTNIYTIEQICNKISIGTFEDLYIGDYFDVAISTSFTENEILRCVFAGFNPYTNNENTFYGKNYAIIVVKNCFKTMHTINLSLEATGQSFYNTDMFMRILPIYNNAFKDAINFSALNGIDHNFTGFNLLTEIMIWGRPIYTTFNNSELQHLNTELPLFRLDSNAKIATVAYEKDDNIIYVPNAYWLMNIHDGGKNMSAVDYYGYPTTYPANCTNVGTSFDDGTSQGVGIRPYFCLW